MDRLRDRDKLVTVPPLIKALRAENVRVINRAAWALGNLEAMTAVPQLVGALVSTEERMVIVPPEGDAAANPGSGLGPVLMRYNGSSLGFLTPPAMAPGAVAYGAYSVPYVGVPPLAGGSVLGLGSAPNRGPVPRVLTYTYQNTEVLAALVKLTGQDFGYDSAAWRRWMKNSFNPNPNPVRRVPQP